jgi:hypothetical protein
MRGTARLLVACTVATIALEGQAVGQSQARVPMVQPAWQPMGALAPVSVAPGERIVLGQETWESGKPQVYDVIEKVAAGAWASWGRRKLTKSCMTLSPAFCTATWGPITTTWAPAVEVRALLDLVGGGPSEIYTFQAVGTLASPASSSAGMVRVVLQPGQSLRLLNDRTLYQTPRYGWGATDLVLYAGGIGGAVVGKWTQEQPLLVTGPSREVAVVHLLGQHRADNCGVPQSILSSAK